MDQKKDFEHLQYALDNYEVLMFRVRPFSLGYETKTVFEDLKGKTLNFKKDNRGLIFFTNERELITFPLKNYRYGFKLEYQDERGFRIYPYYGNNPNDLEMPLPKQSEFRHIIDDLLLEISFKGKILLEEDNDHYRSTQYWKLKRK
jgi:hypothetical protein